MNTQHFNASKDEGYPYPIRRLDRTIPHRDNQASKTNLIRMTGDGDRDGGRVSDEARELAP